MQTWIVFTSSNRFHGLFFRSGFEHCCVIGKDEFNWFLFDPGINQCDFRILGCEVSYPLIEKLRARKKITALKVERKWRPQKSIHRFPIFNLPTLNCVKMVKYFMGIRNWSITPYGLYKSLLKKR